VSRPMRGRVCLPRKKESQRGAHLGLGLRAGPALIYYVRELFRRAQISGDELVSMLSAAHQAARRGRPRVAADAGEGVPPPPTRSQRGDQPGLGLRAVPALRV